MDIAVSLACLAVLAPFMALIAIAVFAGDGHSPLYRAVRIGRGGRPFAMLKFRSMRVGADGSGVLSTAADDPRITRVGRFLRRFKLDELMQLCNVLRGDMSLVGPRPNVPGAAAGYTAAESALLSVRPGMTDLASIVFADEGEILRNRPDPDAAYDRLIRPWKSRLGLFCVQHAGLRLDAEVLALTALAFVSRAAALRGVASLLASSGAAPELVEISLRRTELAPAPPPGASPPNGVSRSGFTEPSGKVSGT